MSDNYKRFSPSLLVLQRNLCAPIYIYILYRLTPTHRLMRLLSMDESLLLAFITLPEESRIFMRTMNIMALRYRGDRKEEKNKRPHKDSVIRINIQCNEAYRIWPAASLTHQSR